MHHLPYFRGWYLGVCWERFYHSRTGRSRVAARWGTASWISATAVAWKRPSSGLNVPTPSSSTTTTWLIPTARPVGQRHHPAGSVASPSTTAVISSKGNATRFSTHDPVCKDHRARKCLFHGHSQGPPPHVKVSRSRCDSAPRSSAHQTIVARSGSPTAAVRARHSSECVGPRWSPAPCSAALRIDQWRVRERCRRPTRPAPANTAVAGTRQANGASTVAPSQSRGPILMRLGFQLNQYCPPQETLAFPGTKPVRVGIPTHQCRAF